MWLKITNNYSPNFSLPKRSNKKIKYIVIHYTGMKSESAAIRRLCDASKNVSAHYFIKNNGEVINLVPDIYESWHAGKSRWNNHNSLNKSSIGIEIHNPGHINSYKKFSSKQLKSLRLLLKRLIKIYKIDLKNILGHSDIAPERKKDPGEKFPWKKLAKSNLAIWHKLNELNLKKDRLKKLHETEKKFFLKYLCQFGYRKIDELNSKLNMKIITKAFQRRFRQSLINGIPDKECFLIIKSLLKS
ncbi:N-acetylmuramoyl-L-alanine amidase [Candidatus Pelagibacter sp.]|nr:N-acetylmuramoyl-L-alanine amidase [Candidatus Pelagibacter sp.]